MSAPNSVKSQPTHPSNNQAPDVRFLLLPLPEFAMLPFGAFVDKLRFSADDEDYSQQRHCRWTILGLEPGSIVASSGIGVDVQVTADQIRLNDYDYLVVFGSRTSSRTLAMSNDYSGLLRQAAAKGLTLVGIDNACFMLAAAGLLSNHKVAVHWRHQQEFYAEFPRIDVHTDQLYCIDGKRISCAGGTAAIDLAIELLARHCGRTRALKGLADMLVDEARGESHQLKSLDQESGVGRHVGRAIALMRTQLAEKSTTEQLAAIIGISRRQLDRLFQQQFAQSTHEYWHEMRMQHLRWRLLNSHHNLASLADEIGIQDSSYLCRVFRKRFGQSPNSLRQ